MQLVFFAFRYDASTWCTSSLLTHGKAVVTESYSQPNNKNNHNHGPSFYTFKQKDFWFKALIVKAVNDNPTLNNREVGLQRCIKL